MKQEDIDKIRKYIEICKKISSSHFIKEVRNVKFNFNYDSDKLPSAEMVLHGLDEFHFKSALMDFRKIYAKTEKVRFYNICQLLLENTNDEELIARINEIKDLYSSKLKRAEIGFHIDDSEQDPEKIISDWFNGSYFHEDENKAATLKGLGFANPLHKVIFIYVVSDLMRYSICLANNAIALLEERHINPNT